MTGTNHSKAGDTGIECSKEQLLYGNCRMNMTALLGIQKTDTQTPDSLVQDVVLASLTFFGTILTIGLVIAGIKIISYKEQTSKQGKRAIWYSVLAVLLVAVSYSAMRLIQFIAKG